MRKRLISNKYLRDVKEYIIKIDYSNDDYWLSIKKIIDATPFILSNGLKVIDNGYYILELLPKNEKYSMRVFLNEKKEVLEYYFDISLGNGIDEETRIPYYDDAFIDITITNDQIEIIDEDELEDALVNGIITKEDYDIIKEATNQLYKEIKEGTNKYVNMDIKDLL
jgi:predicted RNA-binding protein associated with RNAse of E/G family